MESSLYIPVLAVLFTLLCSVPVLSEDGGRGPVIIEIVKDTNHTASCWLESSLNRIYPTSPVGEKTHLQMNTARNARLSFQAVVKNNGYAPTSVECSVETPDDIKATVRRVGYVPMRAFTWHIGEEDLDGIGYVPGLVPDPLHPESTAFVHSLSIQPFWITLDIPAEATVGLKELTVRLHFGGLPTPAEMKVEIDVKDLVVQPRKDFLVTHWWNADAIYDYYKVEPLGDEWFKLAEAYLANMLSHGSNVIFVPLFHHRREVVPRPAQLLKVDETSPGVYEFDWTKTRRFVQMAKELGFNHFEWPYFWMYWGAENPVRVYQLVDGEAKMLFPPDLDAHGAVFHNFMHQFLPEFHEFLLSENILEKSFFHVSDEPGEGQHLINYRKARAFLDEYAPWMSGKIMDALSSIEYGRQGLTDIPIPDISSAPAYIAEDIPHWVYYCCGPGGPYTNRFFDTPLIKVRMQGMLFYKLHALGFLHWGYNYWYVMDLGDNPIPQDFADPWQGGVFMPYGDGHVVYPGPAGPVDSIRWEVFAEALQDYAILQSAGIDPDDPMFNEIIDYARFPRSEEWLNRVLETAMTK